MPNKTKRIIILVCLSLLLSSCAYVAENDSTQATSTPSENSIPKSPSEKELEKSAVAALAALVGEILEKVEKNWVSPEGPSGLKVILNVKVDPGGEVTSVTVWRSSGDADFDRSAEDAIRKSSPLPFPDNPDYYDSLKEFVFEFFPEN